MTKSIAKVEKKENWDELVLEGVLANPDRQYVANACDSRVRWIERHNRASFIELGMVLTAMDQSELWREVLDDNGKPFTSMGRYMVDACPVSRASGYAAMNVLKELKEVPIEDLKKIPRCNLSVLRMVPGKKKSDPKIIEAAKTKDENTLRKTIQEVAPESHVEVIEPMRFKPEESQRKIIDQAIEGAKILYNCSSREEAFEALCTFWLDGMCEHPDYQGRTNSEALILLNGEDVPEAV